MRFLMLVFIIGLFSPSIFLRASNLGVYGAIYSITEPDMLDEINHKLLALKKNGKIEQMQLAFASRSVNHLLRPTPVAGVSDLQGEPSVHFYTPKIFLKKDLFNTQHRLIAKAGTVLNPLSCRNFNEALVFVNGDNPKQLTFVKSIEKRLKNHYSQMKVILVKGDIKETGIVLRRKIYFDQQGKLCKVFGITHTPTIVTQAKKSEKNEATGHDNGKIEKVMSLQIQEYISE